jgi:hypothetical protein
MSTDTNGAESKSDYSACFIHSVLDDYGLSLAEFRLVSHVSRRGNCYESIPNIARVCRMDPKTAKRCIKTIVGFKILSREFRKGRTSILKMRPMADWLPGPKDTPSQTTPEEVEGPDTPPKRHPDHPGQKTPHKGNPSEVNPSKGGGRAPSLENSAQWQLDKDRTRLRQQIEEERASPNPDKDLIAGWRAQLTPIDNEIRRRGRLARQQGVTAPSAASRPQSPINKAPAARVLITDAERATMAGVMRRQREAIAQGTANNGSSMEAFVTPGSGPERVSPSQTLHRTS